MSEVNRSSPMGRKLLFILFLTLVAASIGYALGQALTPVVLGFLGMPRPITPGQPLPPDLASLLGRIGGAVLGGLAAFAGAAGIFVGWLLERGKQKKRPLVSHGCKGLPECW